MVEGRVYKDPMNNMMMLEMGEMMCERCDGDKAVTLLEHWDHAEAVCMGCIVEENEHYRNQEPVTYGYDEGLDRWNQRGE